MSQTEQSPDIKEQRTPLLGNRLNIAKLAIALNPADPPCERSVYNLMDRLNVPYIKVLNVRWYDPDEVRNAILAGEITRQPRRPGRPANRKVAA
jgi:hypothetical protein